MFLIIVAFVSLIALLVIHEFGHFILAKKFGVKVEEFGIGYPPRIFGKKFKGTLFSINLVPFGAFVKIPGEIGKSDEEGSFSSKPIWQRALIIVGGVVSFWIVSAILLSIVMIIGSPTAIGDNDSGPNLRDSKVQIIALAPRSPAEAGGIKIGDTIKKITSDGDQLNVNKVAEVQEFIDQHKGKEVSLTVQRGKDFLNVSLVPRVSPPSGEGAMGVSLARTAIKNYPWYQAPIQGILATGDLTLTILQGWQEALGKIFQGKPSGAQLTGPIGIFSLFAQVGQLGINYFLQFIAIISVNLALFNLLPIPSVDGGKLFFLLIEAVRKKAISEKFEQNITIVFFAMLILLMVFVTIQDIQRLF